MTMSKTPIVWTRRGLIVKGALEAAGVGAACALGGFVGAVIIGRYLGLI